MEKLHAQFVEGCHAPARDDRRRTPRSCSARSRRSPSFGFAKSHAAAFARTAYESAFLKLFYPAQFLVGLINAQPMGFYPVEVLVNDTKRHGVAVLPVDINASAYRTTTEWVGARTRQPRPAVVSSGCVVPSAAARERWTPARRRAGWGVRLGLHLVKGIGEQHEALLDAERARGPYRAPGRRRRADRSARGGPRAAHPERRDGLAGSAAPGAAVAAPRGGRGVTRPDGRSDRPRAGPGGRQARGGRRPADGPAPAGDRRAAAAADHRVGADRRRLRGPRRRCPAPGRRAVPARRWTGSGR